MNHQDINTMVQFADLCLKYFAYDAEYDVSGSYECIEKMTALSERIRHIIPVVDAIVNRPLLTQNISQ